MRYFVVQYIMKKIVELYTRQKRKRRYRIFHFNFVFLQTRIKNRKLETELIENVELCHFLTVY